MILLNRSKFPGINAIHCILWACALVTPTDAFRPNKVGMYGAVAKFVVDCLT